MNNEGELERDKQEEVLGVPSSTRKDQFDSCNLVERFEMANSLSSIKMERVDDCLKENKGRPKKKNSWEPSPASPAQTRSHRRSNVGGRSRLVGRRLVTQVIQDEARRCLVDGS